MPTKSSRKCELNPFKALIGASWLYPFKGIFYFLRHPKFWPLLKGRLLPIFLLSAFIYTNLFLFAYLPQVVFLAIFHSAGAWINATFLTLAEGAAIVALLFEAFFVDETLVDVFDAVLIDEGLEEMVAHARVLDDTAPNSVKMLGKPTKTAIYSPFSFRQIVEFILLLPLNFIPVAGVPLFLFLTGYRAGPFHHWRYFQLLEFTKKERKEYIERRKLKYTWFGMIALLLQLVPVLSMFFLMTSAAGSALWASKMEKSRRLIVAERIEPSEEYRDEEEV